MKRQIDIFDYGRAKVGWTKIGEIANHLGKSGLDIDLVYLFKVGELVITDERLIETLKFLGISFEYIPPSSSLRFIKDLTKEGGSEGDDNA